MLLSSLLFLFVFSLRDGVYGFGRGAPGDVEKTKDAVCNELMPLHYNMSYQDPHTNPFYVKLTTSTDMSSVEVALKVSEVQDVLIMGFLVQGRSEKGEIIGTFDTSLTENITLTCQNTTVSQYKKQWKKEIVLTWLAPEDFQGKVIFHVVVLKNTSEFWRFEAEHAYINTRTCKKGAGCFRCPENSCMVQWMPSDDVIKFDVEATHEIMVYSYVAIGLSHNMKMGDDSITECFIDGKGERIVRMSWNEGNINQQLSEPMSSIVPGSTSVSLADGVLRCTFTRYLRSTSRDNNEITSRKVYYPGDSEYYLMVAIGDVDPDGNLEMHHQRFHSLEKINFNMTDITIHPSVDYGKYLIKAHGTMMVVSWLLLASFASILPRYFKKKLQGVKIFKKPFWFALHQSIMLMVAGLTITSFILIFIKVGGYAALEFPGSVHPPLGILVTILVLLNPIMALFRCDSGSNKRWIFDLFHFFVGQSVLIIAVITIFLSVSIKSSGLKSPMIGLLSFHVCWHILTELMLTAHDKHVASLTKSVIQSADILMKYEKEITISDSGSLYASPRVPSVIVLVYLIVSIANTLVVAVMIWRA